jgi:hypothetical protein
LSVFREFRLLAANEVTTVRKYDVEMAWMPGTARGT